MIDIYQIKPRGDQVAARIKCDLMFSGSNIFKPDMLEHFSLTCRVDTDDFEEAFELTNLWGESDDRILLNYGCHSTSVGDIFRCGDTYKMVDAFGFTTLHLFTDECEVIHDT